MIGTIVPRQRGLTGILFASLLCCAAGPASAYTIALTGGSSGGNPGGQPLYEVSGLVQGDAFNVSWGGVSGVNVTGMVTIDSLTANNADIRVMLDNMSTPISGSDPRVTTIGLQVDGYSSLASAAAGGTFLTLASSTNFPGFTTNACATSGSNCAGGGNGGIPAGGSDTAILDVDGTFPGTLKLSTFALKVQGGPGGNSFELAGVPRPKVPEPASMALAAMGVAGLWMGRRSAR